MGRRKSVVENAMTETEKADKAKAGVSSDQIQPDFARALRVLKSDIDPAIEGMAETRGDVSAAWKIISDECHVNKAAARFFRVQVLNASEEKSWDVLRSLAGLLKAANIDPPSDLVDRITPVASPGPGTTTVDGVTTHAEPMFH
jgi:mannitol-1-phosphate/altronate dehydrogenase